MMNILSCEVSTQRGQGQTSGPFAVELPGAGTVLQRYRIRMRPSPASPRESVRRQVFSDVGLESEYIPSRYRLTSLIVSGTLTKVTLALGAD
jgi:hypothetical protein